MTHLQLIKQQEINKQKYGKERGTTIWALSYSAIHALLGLPKIPIKGLIDPIRTVFDSNYRIQQVMKPLDYAVEKDLVSNEEYEQVTKEVQMSNLTPEETRRRSKVLSFLLAWYVGTGQIINTIELSAIFGPQILDDRLTQVLAGLLIGEILPSIIRPLSTAFIGLITCTDLKTATVVSMLPKGLYGLAIPAQLASETAGRNNLLWHLHVRNLIANLTRLFPQGGWNSQAEGDWYRRVGKHFENLARPKVKTSEHFKQ